VGKKGVKYDEDFTHVYPGIPSPQKKSETDFNHPLGNATEVFSIF